MKTYAPCYFYPTTVLCVDDDFGFLKSLKAVLEAHNHVVDFYSAFEAEAFLRNALATLSDTRFMAAESFDRTDIHVEVNKIHELIYDAKRFGEVSTLIVDYYMPGMDGFTFCRNFTGSSYKKIMLTGEADQAFAVSAFNEAVIDQFVMKGSGDPVGAIQALVQKMQRQFFKEQTKSLVEALLQIDLETFSYFTDSDFCEKLQCLLAEHRVKEGYLFNQRGDYLLIDEDNVLLWLNIRTSKAYQDLKKEAKGGFLEDPFEEIEAIYNAVEKKEKLPLFSLVEEYPNIEDWDEILVSPVEIRTPQDTYQVLMAKDLGKAALRYQDIKFFS